MQLDTTLDTTTLDTTALDTATLDTTALDTAALDTTALDTTRAPAAQGHTLAPARNPARRAAGRLLHVDAQGGVHHRARADLATLLRAGDLVVVNDAATLPASLLGVHTRSAAPVEVRLAARISLDAREPRVFRAVLMGEGDWRTPTERRPLPPALRVGDELKLGPLRAEVLALDAHPRLFVLRFEGDAASVWEGLTRHGRPVQYSYLDAPLALWDVQTVVAGPPVAVEPPSAGFVLDHATLQALRAREVECVRLTHAAGLSSTGDETLDAMLPLPEPYHVPAATAARVEAQRARGGRIIALGTTVVRALESARDARGRIAAGPGLATLRIGPGRLPRVVDAILTGMHEPGTSHHLLLEGFAGYGSLMRAAREAAQHGYLGHEFGDACFVERAAT